MKQIIRNLLDGYGSFFGLTNPISKILILVCALLQPMSGLCGLLGGISVIAWLRALKLRSECERIEVVNGILLGMLLGSLYSPDWRVFAFTVCGALLIVLFSAAIAETLSKVFRLPLLGLPYASVSFALLPVISLLGLAAAQPAIIYQLPLPPLVAQMFIPLGAIYFNGTQLGGIAIFVAFFISSPYLALLALSASAVCVLYMNAIGLVFNTTTTLVAQMNGVLTAAVIGGLFAVPGRMSLFIALIAAVVACTFSLCAAQLLWVFHLPMLAVPFVATTYLFLIALGRKHGGEWTYFWLTTPSLPEKSIEQLTLARARGVDPRSVGLKLPVTGQWQVYQGFGGQHTHRDLWYYALDLFQVDDNGRSFSGDGDAVSDYYCYEKPVFAPAFGVVAAFRSDVADNRPGDVDLTNNWGNYVLLRLDSGLYCLLAHLQQGSVKVTIGTRVAPGDLLANCGNSGRSPQPHLHIQVQEGCLLDSRTIPFHFAGVVVGNEELTYDLHACPTEGVKVASPVNNLVLKRALRFAVGSKFVFEVTAPNAVSRIAQFEVELDMQGQFWLCSERGAKAAFVANDDLVAFFNRIGPADLALDTFILAMGLTPIADGTLRWNDCASLRLLPLSTWQRVIKRITLFWKPCAATQYRRQWTPLSGGWQQSAEHTVGTEVFHSEATISDTNGVVAVKLSKKGRSILNARLIGFGLKEDEGIPEVNAVFPIAV